MADIKATNYKRFDDDLSSSHASSTPIFDKDAPTRQALDPSKLMLPKIRSSHVNLRYKKAVLALAIMQIILGIFSAAANTIVIGSTLTASFYMIMGLDSSGIWGGVISVIAGAFGIAVRRKSNGCRIVAYLVLSTIAAATAGVGVVFSSYWLPTAEYFSTRSRHYGSNNFAPLVGCSVGVIVCLTNVVVSITSAAFMCTNAACCCCNNGSSQSGAGTVYIAVPMETITEVVTKNIGANSKVVVMPYKA